VKDMGAVTVDGDTGGIGLIVALPATLVAVIDAHPITSVGKFAYDYGAAKPAPRLLYFASSSDSVSFPTHSGFQTLAEIVEEFEGRRSIINFNKAQGE